MVRAQQRRCRLNRVRQNRQIHTTWRRRNSQWHKRIQYVNGAGSDSNEECSNQASH